MKNHNKANERKKQKEQKGNPVRIFLDLLYPPRCPVCDEILRWRERDELCCADCAARLPWVQEPACMKCGKPVADYSQEYCDDCQRDHHFYDRGVAAFTYTGMLRHSVYRMKMNNRRDYLDFYAAAMVHSLQPHLEFWQPELLLPVPMFWKKKIRRGYNQSELLAEKISGLTGIPADTHALACTREHTAQKLLGRKERLKNLAGSFAVKKPLGTVERVLIIDDVYTTGSTVDELSRVLKEAGVKKVYFLVLCTGKGKKTVCTKENVCYTK